MSKTTRLFAALAVTFLLPTLASASLIQAVTLTDYTENGTPIGDVSFGTLSFPTEFQLPDEFTSGTGTCAFSPASPLPACEQAAFMPDFDAFPGFDNIGDTGVSLPESIGVNGFWSINDAGELSVYNGAGELINNIFAWLSFELGDNDLGESNGVLTLVFGRRNICGTVEPQALTLPQLGSCFEGANDEFVQAYRTDPVSIPEPGTLALLGLGLAAMGLRRRRA